MPTEYRNDKTSNWFDEEHHRCDVCDWPIDIVELRTPSGGRHHAPSTVLQTDSTTGRIFYDLAANDAGQGCPACGSPAWKLGGRAGDMKRGGW